MELSDIQKIMALMDEHGLNEFELVKDGTRLSLRRGPAGPALVASPAPAPAPQAVAPAPAPAVAPSEPAKESKYAEVKAPFVGTFYRAASPDAEPYVSIGQEVSVDTVLCIVEAMKVMNEIKAEFSGVIREILIENAQPVQFGQVMFRIEEK